MLSRRSLRWLTLGVIRLFDTELLGWDNCALIIVGCSQDNTDKLKPSSGR